MYILKMVHILLVWDHVSGVYVTLFYADSISEQLDFRRIFEHFNRWFYDPGSSLDPFSVP